jgi:ribosome-associated protein
VSASGDLVVTDAVTIPAAELHEAASRSSGPGGQHVNKASTRVTLRWCVPTSVALDPAQRRRALRRLEHRLTRRGHLVVHAGRFRSRSRNQELARERLAELVREALHVRARRVATRPSRASRERALTKKRRRASLKRGRGRVPRDDEK